MDFSSIIKKPYITEKTNKIIADENKYVFVVDGRASKTQVKDAVEKFYNVTVINVNMMPKPVKMKRSWVGKRGQYSTSSTLKKTIVQLKEKQSLPIFSGGAK